MSDPHLNSMMENLYWWGIPTLFRCPNQAADGADIALVGVPHSAGNGTTERDQHLGPRALRNVSAVQRRMHGDFQLDPWTAANIVDVGDVPFPRANDNEDCIQQITDFYKNLDAKGVRPVSIGGDHSITGGIVQALGKGAIAGGEPVCFLHLDAHTDVFTKVDHFLGAKKSAAHWGCTNARLARAILRVWLQRCYHERLSQTRGCRRDRGDKNSTCWQTCLHHVRFRLPGPDNCTRRIQYRGRSKRIRY